MLVCAWLWLAYVSQAQQYQMIEAVVDGSQPQVHNSYFQPTPLNSGPSKPQVPNVYHPCDMPSIGSDDFQEMCLRSYRKRFVCAIPNREYKGGKDITLAELNMLEKIIRGMFSFCHYDTLMQAAQPVAIGDFHIKKEFEEERVRVLAEFKQHGEDRSTRNHLHDAVQDVEQDRQLLIRPLNYRPTISITLINDYKPDKVTDVSNCSRIGQQSTSMASYRNMTTDDREQFLANVTRARWSKLYGAYNASLRPSQHNFQSPNCETDIAILVLTTESGRQRIRLSFSQYYGPLFTRPQAVSDNHGHLDDLLDALNEGDRVDDKLKDKLQALLDHLFTIVAVQQPLNAKPEYSVPLWAIYVFVGCLLLSSFAAMVGSWINTKSRSRGTNGPMPTANNRKWAAGFSGGLWAS